MTAASDYLWPLPDSRTLTGGFADSRTDHFHGGVDLRARTPLPVIAPTDGWVERISVNPAGYGLTLYYRLADGNTAVFGHLSRYEPELQALVRDSQLVAETYHVDFSFEEPAQAPSYRKGDILCFTGSSGRGPAHLHFEVRKGAVQLDPLMFYDPADRDKPVIVELRWVNWSEFSPTSSGRAIAKQVTPTINSNEPIALFVRTYDPGPWGRNAVPQTVRVFLDQQLIFEDRCAEIDLLGPQSIYEKLVYKDVKHNDRDVRRLFDWPLRGLTEADPLPSGWIENFRGDVRIEVEDRNGNISSYSVRVDVGDSRPDRPLPDRAVPLDFVLTGDDASMSWADVAELSGEIRINDEDFAFASKLRLTAHESYRPGTYWYKRSGAAGKSALWRIPSDDPDQLACYVLRGGIYGLAYDDTPPKLLLSGQHGKIKFTLTDDESSIDDSSVRCTVDGETAIPEFEYEEKGGVIWTRKSLTRGQHLVHFEAQNRAGLSRTWEVAVTVP